MAFDCVLLTFSAVVVERNSLEALKFILENKAFSVKPSKILKDSSLTNS